MRSGIINVSIGWDYRERLAFHVLAYSINKQSTKPVAIQSIDLHHLDNILWRERHDKQSTDFAFSRFCVPYLANFEGWSIFMDCDFLCRADIVELWRQRDDNYAVQVVKHDYTPVSEFKMDHVRQTVYPRKNWSSLMLFNNAKCRRLTPQYVNTADGLDLHRFNWLNDDTLIGDLDPSWNHLVGEYDYSPDAKMVHFTLGGPWMDEVYTNDYVDEWNEMRDEMLQIRN
jgi:lipopolysaccharide biosynthesis glycosyltransferase